LTHLDTAKESDLKSTITNYLITYESMGFLWFERLNSGKIKVLNKDGSTRMVNLCRKGTADFIVIFSKPLRPVFIETKRKNAEQIDSQIEFENKVKEMGFEYYVADTFEKFEKLMNELGLKI
jgi:hypothetical protein